MKKTNINLLSIVLIFICTSFVNSTEISNNTFRIPTAGNSWVISHNEFIKSDIITKDGIRNWDKNIIRTYLHINKTGEISLGLGAKINLGSSKIKVTLNNQSQIIEINNKEFIDIQVGQFIINTPGYYYIDMEGIEKSGNCFAEINDLIVGNINENEINYIKDEFYWSRRGPSVHLKFEIPTEAKDVEWFYSEIEIPKGQDVIGSYFMANGFGEGYFGIQANSLTEKRILFSVWSPFKTDNPNEIPEDYKIKLIKKGDGVITKKFGNEGSGGQSYKVYNWKTEVTYGFLLRGQPTNDNSTIYTAYFFDPEINTWILIAQFERPKTNTTLKNLYSFLENFKPQQGVFERKGIYKNQWVYNKNGWHELNKIKFTGDNTARKQNRMDFSGGVENNAFFLQNCGFTNNHTKLDSKFSRNKQGTPPIINFTALK